MFLQFLNCFVLVAALSNEFSSKHRAGQRCFELLALIGSPQLSFKGRQDVAF